MLPLKCFKSTTTLCFCCQIVQKVNAHQCIPIFKKLLLHSVKVQFRFNFSTSLCSNTHVISPQFQTQRTTRYLRSRKELFWKTLIYRCVSAQTFHWLYCQKRVEKLLEERNQLIEVNDIFEKKIISSSVKYKVTTINFDHCYVDVDPNPNGATKQLGIK